MAEYRHKHTKSTLTDVQVGQINIGELQESIREAELRAGEVDEEMLASMKEALAILLSAEEVAKRGSERNNHVE